MTSISNFLRFFIFKFICLSISLSQSIEIGTRLFINEKKPFWIISNNNGFYNYGSITNLKYIKNQKNLDYGLDIALPFNSSKTILVNRAFVNFKKNNIYLSIGRKRLNDEGNLLSSGSLIESSNAIPIPKVSFGIDEYHEIAIGKIVFSLKGNFAHGWLDKGRYIKAPYLHEKSLYLNKTLFNGYSFGFGLVHKVIWAGETEIHGKQPNNIGDLFRVIFARPGSEKSINQEQENRLGNHLGVWDISISKEYNNKLIKVYLEHPFEDESSARWILNEFDGKYGIAVSNNNSNLLSNFVYEYINTMDQSGSEGASDSTYGWDNYYNHYLYQSGWTYYGRVIGNPLFTLGFNKGRYSDGEYIINNRIKAHHLGVDGSISKVINYRILYTYSENFGIFPDQDYYNSINENYNFDKGLIQRSALIELIYNRFWRDLNLAIGYGLDNGELLTKTDSFVIKIDYKFKL